MFFDFVFFSHKFFRLNGDFTIGQYRKRNTELASLLANSDSSDADTSYNNNECTGHDIADDKVDQKSGDYRGGSVCMHYEPVVSSDSDYGYDEAVFSSDAEGEFDNLIAKPEEEAYLKWVSSFLGLKTQMHPFLY